MLLKMVVNKNDNTRTLFWTNKPADIMSRYDYNYSAEIHNMYDHGVKGYKNDRITVYERPTENRGCNDYDNTAHCIDIAHELDAIAGGDLIRCPICGELVSTPYIEGDNAKLDCGCKVDIDDLDDLDGVSMWDYLRDTVLDVKYTVDNDLDYASARAMIAFGGPNIYIDTDTSRVELFWGSSETHAYIDYRTRDAIDVYFNSEYNCRRDCL
nr:MAG TPA: hypothetical protein [Caudoviricetes sp.]DAU88636.1 MAG TPA: hypothetical protein [Caudoviricetes sp.]